jgi:aminodeoxyfutalosine deaminase
LFAGKEDMNITADFILNEDGYLTPDLVLNVRDDGTIVDIFQNTEDLMDVHPYEGILIPGLFNCHIHLELAGAEFGEISGLEDFLVKMKDYQIRNKDNANCILQLDRQLYEKGTEFCADIANTERSVPVKIHSKMIYHTFIEIFETLSDLSPKKFQQALHTHKKFSENQLQSSVVPHSCYTISPSLIRLIGSYNVENKKISSIHFKENFKENDLFLFQQEIYNVLNNNSIEFFIQKFYPSNILTVMDELFDEEQKVVLVHNIYLNQNEREWLLKHQKKCALCICPSSNLNIEKKMADKSHLEFFEGKVFFGTDSPASNPEMNLIREMYLAQINYGYSLGKILQMATIDPALYFEVKNKGKIQKGKKPGIVLIKGVNMREMKLTGDSETIRLI